MIYSTINFYEQKALRLKSFNPSYFFLGRRKRRTIKRDTKQVSNLEIKSALVDLIVVESRVPEVLVGRTGCSGCTLRPGFAFQKTVPGFIRKSQYGTEVLVGEVWVSERVAEISSGLYPKVLVGPSSSPTVRSR